MAAPATTEKNTQAEEPLKEWARRIAAEAPRSPMISSTSCTPSSWAGQPGEGEGSTSPSAGRHEPLQLSVNQPRTIYAWVCPRLQAGRPPEKGPAQHSQPSDLRVI